MSATAPDPSSKGHSYAILGLVAVAALGIIAIAWAYEIRGGLKPCPLCLKQRWAYYFAIPALAFILLAMRDLRHGPGALLLAFVVLAFTANMVLAGYHAGVEWKWWPGPSACSGGGAVEALQSSAGGLLDTIEQTRVIRCDEAAWRFMGLSFAGWNVIISFVFAAACFSVFRREFQSNN